MEKKITADELRDVFAPDRTTGEKWAILQDLERKHEAYQTNVEALAHGGVRKSEDPVIGHANVFRLLHAFETASGTVSKSDRAYVDEIKAKWLESAKQFGLLDSEAKPVAANANAQRLFDIRRQGKAGG
ncbi:MAG: hypothetical protein OXT65_01325 [Alphaproteobacteria bacterium]|nr:hypothetical protein [Alphaproteobacteria bacterium]